MENCIFCQIIRGEEPSYKVWEDDQVIAFLSRRPCNTGHILLVPKVHIDYLFDVEEPLYSHILKCAKFLSRPLKSATQAKRIGVAVEGFSVHHLHIHLVPVNAVAELDPHRCVDMTSKELAECAEKIRREIAHFTNIQPEK